MLKQRQTASVKRRKSRLQDTGRFMPREFSDNVWWKFNRKRRREYLAEHVPGGDPTPTQARLITELIAAEWERLRLQAQANGEPYGKRQADLLRLVDRARQQIILLGRDLTAATTRREVKVPPKEQPKSYRDLVAERAND